MKPCNNYAQLNDFNWARICCNKIDNFNVYDACSRRLIAVFIIIYIIRNGSLTTNPSNIAKPAIEFRVWY